jgi:hypothetical protein
MSHPKNRLERHVIGYHHGVRRSNGYSGRWPLPKEWSEEKVKEWKERDIGLRKDTTKLCSCSMCRNPRHSGWYNSGDQLTMQERRELERDL